MAGETEEEKLRRKFANLPSSGRIGPTTAGRTIEQIGLDIQKLIRERELHPETPTSAADLLEIQRLGREIEELYQREAAPRARDSTLLRLIELVDEWDRVAYGMLRNYRAGAYALALKDVQRLIGIDNEMANIIRSGE